MRVTEDVKVAEKRKNQLRLLNIFLLGAWHRHLMVIRRLLHVPLLFLRSAGMIMPQEQPKRVSEGSHLSLKLEAHLLSPRQYTT